MPYNHFTGMPVWQKADEIIGEVYKLTETAGYFSNEQIEPIGKKCMKVVEELNKIIKGLGD